AEALGVPVTAFLEEPAERPQTGPGRPPKPRAEPADRPAPKRPRGRPRKEKRAGEGILLALGRLGESHRGARHAIPSPRGRGPLAGRAARARATRGGYSAKAFRDQV